MRPKVKHKPIFTIKQKIQLFFYILVIVGLCLVVAFLIPEQNISRFSLWISMVVGFGTILTSALALAISMLSIRKTEQLRLQQLEEDANRFINENNSEIQYIPLCLIANAYDKHHIFSRKIYNSFNLLNKDLQEEVLKQLQYDDYELIPNNRWINKEIQTIRDYISKNDLGEDYLYDNAKYFHLAIEFAEYEYNHSYEHCKIMPDLFHWNSKIIRQLDPEHCDRISFYDFLDSYIYEKKNRPEEFEKNKDKKPLSILAGLVNFPECPDEVLCCWIMEIMVCVGSMIERESGFNYDETPHLSRGDASIETYEDRYLEVLMELYNLYLFDKFAQKKER